MTKTSDIKETPFRPETDESTYPDILGFAGSSCFYFYDLDTREEIKGHPLSAMRSTGEGAMVTIRGQRVDGSADCVFGNAWLGGKMRRVFVDADSFPGRRVAVKCWHPTETSWRFLAKGDGSKPTTDSRLPASTLTRAQG
jgi:hypothetical protein